MGDAAETPHDIHLIDRSKLRLLIVEAEDFAARIVRGLRARLNFDVLITSVRTMQAASKSPSFDLAVVGSDLPDGDGRQLVATWRGSPRRRRTPVLYVTSQPLETVAHDCLRLRAPALPRSGVGAIVDCAATALEMISREPRSAMEEVTRYGEELAREAGMSNAMRDVCLLRLAGKSNAEIAIARKTSLSTVEGQSKQIVAALRTIGLDTREEGLTATVLRELIESRYDDE